MMNWKTCREISFSPRGVVNLDETMFSIMFIQHPNILRSFLFCLIYYDYLNLKKKVGNTTRGKV